MIYLIAQATAPAATLPDPNSFSSVGWVLVILVALATGVNQIWKFVDRVRGRNITQPLEIKPAVEYAKREELERVSREVAALREERRRDIDAAAGSREKMYVKIEAVRAELSTKIDNMPSQLITILKNTGAIE